MKPISFVFAASLALAGAFLLKAAPGPKTANPIATSSNLPPCCVTAEKPAGPVSGLSIYNLDASWTNDFGAAVKLKSLRGRPQVITMFFASCEYACPVLAHDMKRIEAALPEDLRGRIGFALISFDGERDTPAALAKYRHAHFLPENWSLFQGGEDGALELAALLGVKFKKDARGQYAHSNVITILNAEGEIVFQQNGLNVDPTSAAAALKKLF